MIFSEHTSNDLKFIKPLDSEGELIRSHEAYDLAAQEVVDNLSERLQCLAVCANFSRLIIDPGQSLLSKQLVRTHFKELDEQGDPIPISFNYTGYRLFERLDTYYLEYHKLLSEAMDYLEPEIVVNIHTHDPILSKVESDVVLYSPDFHSALLHSMER